MFAILSLPKKVWEFLKSVATEMRFVEWLSRKDTVNITLAVVILIIVFGLLLAFGDQGLKILASKVLSLELFN